MRRTTLAIILGTLLFWDLSASADTFTLNVTGVASDDEQRSIFEMTGTGLTIEATNDFGPQDITGLIPGQSYSLSYTVEFEGDSDTFVGLYDGVQFTGNGSITWQFTLVVPSPIYPFYETSVQVPGTVTGAFSFCSPTESEQVSSCGPEDNPLGSGTLTGTGTDTAVLDCDFDSSGTCVITFDELNPFSATADITTVPEPPTLFLILGSLLMYPLLRFLRRPSSERLRQVRSSLRRKGLDCDCSLRPQGRQSIPAT
jgi:hypothetical protein